MTDIIRPLAAVMLGAGSMCCAAIELPDFVTDSMVVQQNSVLRVSGKARGNVEVSASWLPEDIRIKTRGGVFSADIPTPAAGGPHTLTFADADGRRTLSDVWAGEVWLCSGQSNMEMPVGGWGKVMDYEAEIAAADYPEVRLLQIKKSTSPVPLTATEVNMGGWRTATPSTVDNFSAIAYFFARQLSRELGVHVGVIDCTWGGTPAEAWTSAESVAAIPGFEKETEMLRSSKGDIAELRRRYDREIDEWTSSATAGDSRFDPAVMSGSGSIVSLPAYIEDSKGAFDGIFWLQREIELPAGLAGKPLELHLGMIDDEDITYFNGQEIARGSGYNVPRVYTVPGNLVKSGTNLISVRVCDFGGEGGMWGKPEQMYWQSGDAKASLAGNWTCSVTADFASLPPRPLSAESSSFPSVLYNAMLSPLKDFPVKGVIWYQGCANVGRAAQYGPLFRTLINDWRTLLAQPDMPFYFMQLAGYLTPKRIQPDSEWAALRAAQAEALQLPATGMATAIDIGNPDDIHPKNKQEAARRFALLALSGTYGRSDVVAEAPRPVSCHGDGNRAVLTFDRDVTPSGARAAGFIVCGNDGRWSVPVATVAANTVTLTAETPVCEVRYNWADYPDGNLRGSEGLPVTPFAIIPQ